jgi:hypothetical protein
MAGKLRKAMIAAIRSNRDRIAALEEKTRTIPERCEEAPATRPLCVAIGPRGGCLITPLHAVYAGHYPLAVGSTIRYEWGERRVVATKLIGQTDVAIATLDSPADCEPARILPWDWANTLKTDRFGKSLRKAVRCLGSKASGEVVQCRLHRLGDTFGAAGPFARGDSGQPVWLPLPEPVLIGCLHRAGSGPAIHHYWRDVILACLNGTGVAPKEATW